jgi:hypothetical protein
MNFHKIMFLMAACLGVVMVTQPMHVCIADKVLPKDAVRSMKQRKNLQKMIQKRRIQEQMSEVQSTHAMLNIANTLKPKTKKQNQEIVTNETEAVRNEKSYFSNLGRFQNQWRLDRLRKQFPEQPHKNTNLMSRVLVAIFENEENRRGDQLEADMAQLQENKERLQTEDMQQKIQENNKRLAELFSTKQEKNSPWEI